MVPKGWTLGTLKDLADTIMGYAFRSEDFVPTGIPLLRMGNLYQNTLDLNRNPVYLPDSFKVDYKRFLVSPGDLVMSMTGTMGKRDYGFTVEIPSNTQCSLLNQRVLKIVPKNNASSGYILNLLRSELILSVLYSFPGGTKQANLSAKQLQELPVLIPPELEQKKIAQILSTWDKAISVTEKLLTNSQQQKKALMQQLLTGKKRLLDENGVRFSREWEKGKFCDMANIDTGYAFKSKDFTQSDSGIPIIRMSDFKTGGLDVLGAAKVDRDSVNGLDKFKLRVGDFVFGMSGSLNNYGRVEKKDLPCYLNQRVGRILAKECANQAFITYLYLSDSIQQSILDKAAGAAQLNISISDLRSMVVYYPCIEEQQKIAAVLSVADAEIATLEKKLACLRDEKKALMQQLLTGKRRVKVDEAVAE
ncbi:TPA: restriction endonuclease subunit S [Escherichia coli]|uniref:restriction endonuclease subunit S n=2 Tax=Escherichia coli TaxID=562 RepID=UPI00094226B9|nr:restriction endonuclease subunit S [Escherichia coli]EFN5124879.1 restriction endonuclease subunit S [Escherichia coli]EFN7985306.1 restriction endonuclease subunit S [Escherichia coli]EIQ9205576.1 restriction endonuclease subunit S [Escherichia coli]EJK7995101.1 restriction endonuclease subunit S [Escherichia coli]EJK8850746.1 restriction endonuclease subunit S [Escherichia coli]